MDGIDVDHEPVMKTSRCPLRPGRCREWTHIAIRGRHSELGRLRRRLACMPLLEPADMLRPDKIRHLASELPALSGINN